MAQTQKEEQQGKVSSLICCMIIFVTYASTVLTYIKNIEFILYQEIKGGRHREHKTCQPQYLPPRDTQCLLLNCVMSKNCCKM